MCILCTWLEMDMIYALAVVHCSKR
jgi:hypothetical protein